MAHSLVTAARAPATKFDSLMETQNATAPGYVWTAEKPLSFWRRLVGTAVADAKRTYAGMPTDSAILARWWIQQHRPQREEKDEWERSFACACDWLDLDAEAERARLLAEIDQALVDAMVLHGGAVVYQRSMAVLSLASGVPRRIGKQFVLGLVSETEYELIAGIDLPDPPQRKRKRARLAKAA